MSEKNRKLEICCYTVESAMLAEASGADRVELCDNFPEGGTTPSYAAVKLAVEILSIPVNVIVRPRGGDFLYSDVEFGIIINDVVKIKELGANGVVVGFLNPDGTIDLERTAEVVNLARPLEVTFHRAFDMCLDPLIAIDQLKRIGVTRILTSGGKNKATDGADLISKLVERAEDKIIIMPGSGVNQRNIKSLMAQTNASEFHSSAKTFLKSRMRYFNHDIGMGGVSNEDEYRVVSVDTEMIKGMASVIR